MEIRVKQGSITEETVDLIIVNLFQGVTEPGGATGSVDAALDAAVRDVIAAGDFTGKAGETLLLYTHGALPAARVLIVGLVSRAGSGRPQPGNAAATAVRKARPGRPDDRQRDPRRRGGRARHRGGSPDAG